MLKKQICLLYLCCNYHRSVCALVATELLIIAGDILYQGCCPDNVMGQEGRPWITFYQMQALLCSHFLK